MTTTVKAHVKGSRGPTRNVLILKESLFLRDLVANSYVSSGLGDKLFAEMVNNTHASSFDGVLTASHISTMREALDISSNHERSQSSKGSRLAERVGELEEQVRRLTTWLANHAIDFPPTSEGN